jgi:hypothetical protein
MVYLLKKKIDIKHRVESSYEKFYYEYLIRKCLDLWYLDVLCGHIPSKHLNASTDGTKFRGIAIIIKLSLFHLISVYMFKALY